MRAEGRQEGQVKWKSARLRDRMGKQERERELEGGESRKRGITIEKERQNKK